MREVILNFPKQFAQGLKLAEPIKVKGDFDSVAVCGMGGSALPANMLAMMAPELNLALYVHRGYGLPVQADKNSFVVVISYSGNTEETLSAFEEAMKKGLKTAVITTNGKLKKLAEKNNIPFLVIPPDALQPRNALGYQTAGLIKILSNAGIIKDYSKEITAAAARIEPAKWEGLGKGLAKRLKNKIPIIYASSRFKYLARIWKIKFNENSKIMAFWNYFPELNHNEMNGYENVKFQTSNVKNFSAIILRDKKDDPRLLKRMNLTARILKNNKVELDFIEIIGNNGLEKIINSLVLADWTSYYLAKEYGVDPLGVEIIEKFKKQLG